MTVKNMALAAAGGSIFILVLVSVFLLYRGFRAFNRAEKMLDQSKSELQSFYAQNPFPSESNVGRIQGNAKVLAEWLDRLMEALRKGSVEPENKTPSTFMNLLSEKRNALQKSARQSGTETPPDFAFGFERYSTGKLPAPSDVFRLTQQLTMIERICTVLFEEKTTHIVSISRDAFEEGGGDTSGDEASGRGARGRGGRGREEPAAGGGEGVARDAGILKEGALYSKLHFKIALAARERTILPILNRLAKSDMFTVVTAVSFAKEGEDVLTPPAPEGASGEGRASEPSVAGDAKKETPVAPAERYPTRRERLVSGPDLEKPMRITLEIDVLNFRAK